MTARRAPRGARELKLCVPRGSVQTICRAPRGARELKHEESSDKGRKAFGRAPRGARELKLPHQLRNLRPSAVVLREGHVN